MNYYNEYCFIRLIDELGKGDNTKILKKFYLKCSKTSVFSIKTIKKIQLCHNYVKKALEKTSIL